MRTSEWAKNFNVGVLPANVAPGNKYYKVYDIFTTRDGSWEPNATPGSIPDWARNTYLRPFNAPDYFDDAGADHHILGAVYDPALRATVKDMAFRYYTWTDNQNHSVQVVKRKSGWANIVAFNSFNPANGERGAWAWRPEFGGLPAETIVGGGMPYKWHVSWFGVWTVETMGGTPPKPVEPPKVDPPIVVVPVDPPTPSPVSGLPKHRMGVHWIADQVRQEDKAYMQQLKPPCIKIVNPSADRVREALQWIDPNGHVALRYHPISEQQAELRNDPIKLGRDHAHYWITQLGTTYKEFPKNKLVVMGINEPTIHNRQDEKVVARYTEEFLKTLKPFGIRAYVFNFSVGWPREEAGHIFWDEFLYLEDLINETGSWGNVHEYWFPNPQTGWNSYANRVSRCPMRIPFIIGECGYTRQLQNLPQPWGWNGNISAQEYANQLWYYHDNVDPGKVWAIQPFTTSFGGQEWRSKDTLPAHAQILAGAGRTFAWSQPWPSYATGEEPMKQYKLVWPRISRITQYFGPNHSGLDISMATGTPLYAPWDGVVAWSDVDDAANGGYGEYIRIFHKDLGFDTFFAHLSRRLVQNGNQVARGQLIGYSGSTGNSTGPHLHLEVRVKQDNGFDYRGGVGPFTRGQVDPLSVRWALHGLFGSEER